MRIDKQQKQQENQALLEVSQIHTRNSTDNNIHWKGSEIGGQIQKYPYETLSVKILFETEGFSTFLTQITKITKKQL